MVGLVDHGYMVPVGPPYGSDCATVMIFTARENCASAQQKIMVRRSIVIP